MMADPALPARRTPLRTPHRAHIGVVAALLVTACGEDSTIDPPPPEVDVQLAADVTREVEAPAPPPGSTPVAVGLFMSGYHFQPARAADHTRRLLAETNQILAQCGMHLVPEAVHVIDLPGDLHRVQGNEVGSWGGHPPDSVGDPDLFTYYENERLTSEARELFAYGKRYTSPNAIAIYIVTGIDSYIGSEPRALKGLSFPPVAYHHPSDYPLRNSVLAARSSVWGGGTESVVVAHELGHMLLDTGYHWGEGNNLMFAGTELTPDQCDRMRENGERLFGDDAIVDPGPPTTPAAAIAGVSGDDQVGKAGEYLELPFAVRVTDARGEPVRHAYVAWRVASGSGGFGGRAGSRTGADGIARIAFQPYTVGTTTVMAEVSEIDGSTVTFTASATTLVISLVRMCSWPDCTWGTRFAGPDGGPPPDVPLGTTLEWKAVGWDSVQIFSTSVPPDGQPFDSGTLTRGERFQFVPGVPGTWEYEERVSGAKGTVTVTVRVAP